MNNRQEFKQITCLSFALIHLKVDDNDRNYYFKICKTFSDSEKRII